MKPMLAGKLSSLDKLFFPCYCTPKLDGIRCLILNGVAVSRNLKPIRNKYIQERLKGLPDGLDGELMLNSTKNFNEVSSAVMSEAGEPDFYYAVFDCISDEPYLKRVGSQAELLKIHPFTFLIRPRMVRNLEEFEAFEKEVLNLGYEGVMIRRGDGIYKFGRSTENEGGLLKWKRFTDSEAEVIGYLEQMQNNNPEEVDNLGHTKRSSHKGNMIPKDTLGALVVRDLKTGIEFNIGTGYTNGSRDKLWAEKGKLIGRIVKYKYQDVGVKEAPRFPVFLGFRDKDDM